MSKTKTEPPQGPPPDLLALAKQMAGFDTTAYLKEMFAKRLLRKYIVDKERSWEDALYFALKTHARPERWDDLMTDLKPAMYIDARTWTPPRLFPTPVFRGRDDETRHVSYFREHTEMCSPRGPKDGGPYFFYANRALPTGHALSVSDSRGNRGKLFFDNEVVTPVLFEMDLEGNQTIWMGLTPMEVMTQRQGLWHAADRVVVGGLGLGWFLNEVCKKKAVTSVVIVEKNLQLMLWLRPAIEAAYPEIATKSVHWVCADVYDYIDADKENWDETKYLLDIWPGFADCQEDPQFAKLKAAMPPDNLWGWGQDVDGSDERITD